MMSTNYTLNQELSDIERQQLEENCLIIVTELAEVKEISTSIHLDILYNSLICDVSQCGDLQSRVKLAQENKRLFREETIWQWFIQLCCAIKHVHDRKILHRDIKSANIFLRFEHIKNIKEFTVSGRETEGEMKRRKEGSKEATERLRQKEKYIKRKVKRVSEREKERGGRWGEEKKRKRESFKRGRGGDEEREEEVGGGG
jgi:serine/threonine protein kinase